ncbi:MAG TPA: flagellar capping protein [Lachnospiraceae bacterium]|nr:flagellar capping protein [Lachnospiraceae bacterium]
MSNAVLTNIYNHYLTTYAPKSTTQYDTHKKSELRSVYNSIVKLNKESPWYLETSSKETQANAVGIKESSRVLHNSIASLGGLDASQALAKKTAYSTNTDVVSAEYIGNAKDEAPIPTLNISIKGLANPQENMGAYLLSENVSLPADSYSFDISINDLNYEFQFNINEGDTNKDVQERLVRLINNADIGIKADVDEGDMRSSIRLTSTATGLPEGKSEIFRITDDRTSMRSGVVEYLGLGYISRKPANSSFLLNGEERSTASNCFTVGKMFELELKSISEPDSSVEVGLKTDVESLTDNVNSLIGYYNSFVSATASFEQSQSISNRLVREVGGIASRYQNQMESMGITIQSDNTLSVDDHLLHTTASEGALPFQALKGFSNALMQKTVQVSLNPMNYVNRTIVAYKNPGHNFASPYITSAYSGMMFNSYC